MESCCIVIRRNFKWDSVRCSLASWLFRSLERISGWNCGGKRDSICVREILPLLLECACAFSLKVDVELVEEVWIATSSSSAVHVHFSNPVWYDVDQSNVEVLLVSFIFHIMKIYNCLIFGYIYSYSIEEYEWIIQNDYKFQFESIFYLLDMYTLNLWFFL